MCDALFKRGCVTVVSFIMLIVLHQLHVKPLSLNYPQKTEIFAPLKVLLFYELKCLYC